MRRAFPALLSIFAAIVLLAAAAPATAGVATSHRLSFQGVARDGSNQPVASGDVRVRIYDAPAGGTLVYDSASEFNGAIVGGIYNVLLGGGTALMLDDTKLYHLELDINGTEVVGDAASGRQAFWPSGGDLSRPDYESRLGALESAVFASCAAGTFNLNGNVADGCEFTLDNNAIYVDGADPGADDNPGCGLGPVGTGAGCRPCQTIARGLIEAASTGRAKVNVANGSYNEGVTLVNGKSLFGGWRSLTWSRDLANTATVIRGKTTSGVHERAIAGSSITNPTTVEGFVIYGPVNTSAAGNSYAVYLSNCGGLTFRSNVIFGGVGGPGTDGALGPDGTAGVGGAAGGNAVQSTGTGCSSVTLDRSGGAGGVLICGGTNVSGGAGGGNRCTPVPNTKFSGLTGTAGNGGGGAGGVAGDDAAISSGSCILPPNSMNGAVGSNGSAGANGTGGVGASNGNGSVSSSQWLGAPGNGGLNGTFGRGGGGGGGGGGADATVSPDKDALGGAGGGGGSGGCGGTAGGGGAAGGGSIGIFIVGGTAPVITGNTITRGNGGAGGRGGNAGRGGSGGTGAAGGSSAVFCAGTGGKGGDGGAGGHGGAGGGAAGGISCGIFTSGIGAPTYGTTNNFAAGGAPGPGGGGGLSLGNNGSGGVAGASTTVVSQ